MNESVSASSINYFQARLKFDGKRNLVWRAITEDIQKRFIRPSDIVADLGCGYGDFINHANAKRKIAIDIEDVNSYLSDDVEFYCNSVVDLNFLETNTIDVVFASNLLEHLKKEDCYRVLSEIGRILKPGGKCILIQPNFRLCYRNYFDDYTHQTVFSDEALCGLMIHCGFTVVHRKAGYLPFSMQGMLPKSYWLTKLYLALGSPAFAKQMLIVGIIG